jgi:histidinol phosphatase-like enzyme
LEKFPHYICNPINTTPCFKIISICKKKIWEKFDKMGIIYYLSKMMDGHKVCNKCNELKPFDDFYELLISKFSIDKSSEIFIDDNYRNIIAAERLGIKSYHFTSAADLKKELINIGILLISPT